MKGYSSGAARWERRTEQVRGKGREASLPSELYILCESLWIYQLAVLQTQFFLVVMETLLPSVQFSSVPPSDSLWPHGLSMPDLPVHRQLLPGVDSNSCPLSRWCHPTISSSVFPFFSCLQSFPASRSFQKSQFFTSGGQSIGVSASTSILPKNIQDWFPFFFT